MYHDSLPYMRNIFVQILLLITTYIVKMPKYTGELWTRVTSVAIDQSTILLNYQKTPNARYHTPGRRATCVHLIEIYRLINQLPIYM